MTNTIHSKNVSQDTLHQLAKEICDDAFALFIKLSWTIPLTFNT